MAVLREVTAHFDAARQREFRRFLTFSACAHLAGFLFMAAVPTLPVMTPPGAITVNLVAPPTASRAAPVAPAPKPAPRPPKPAPVVLPKETSPPVVKPKPEPRPAPKPAAEPAPPAEEDYGDVMAKLRSELGEPESKPEPVPEPARTATLGGGGAGPGRPVSPEVAAWLREARIHVRRTWVVPPGFRTQSLQTVVEVDLDASGSVRGEPQVVRRSGNPWYDEGVVRSIRKASPLPAPPQAGTWTFVMVSDELL
jgi:protein TonB